jgi:hypothetical protein
MPHKPVPDRIATTSRRYGNHLCRKRGDVYHYYCDNCGKHAFAQDSGFTIYPSKRIFCSKECENEYFPKWLVFLVSAVVFAAWGSFLAPVIQDIYHWLRSVL